MKSVETYSSKLPIGQPLEEADNKKLVAKAQELLKPPCCNVRFCLEVLNKIIGMTPKTHDLPDNVAERGEFPTPVRCGKEDDEASSICDRAVR